ncbi:MAG: class I SAM-dependent methyltransferase [Patescibacteria group bacterium]|nr:class I SAM-dependent methyltransferase [Patescibacteria group bacterium]
MKFKLKTIENKRKSIWGKGDKDTLKFLEETKIKGRWLNLAGGDGRYNLNLLKKVDFVIASDVDKGALNKLRSNTPTKYKSKLKIRVFDITKKFPFKDNYFDGVFCTGTLHLLPRKILPKVFREIDRVLNKNGRVIIDFATDLKRISFAGKFIKIGKEPLYKLQEAKNILKKLFKNYRVKIYESEVRPEIVKAKIPYRFSSKFIILIADKK